MKIFSSVMLLMAISYWPLSFNNGITGSFTEYRFGHIHAGFDFSTKGQTGFPVTCFDDGEVYLIKVLKNGYGRVLYVKHGKRNLVSVYGHLERFNDRIEKLVKKKIKEKETRYPGVITPSGKSILLKKGEVVGFSGESGAGFPHLHFELRDMKNRPVNPVELGMDLSYDQTPPEISGLLIYPLDSYSAVNKENGKRLIPLTRTKVGKYGFDIFSLQGNVEFVLMCKDSDGIKHSSGVKDIVLTLNGKDVYTFSADRFSFDSYRESSSVYDFSETSINPTRYGYNLFKLSGTTLECQKQSEVPSPLEGMNLLKIKVSDFNGNSSILEGNFKYIAPHQPFKPVKEFLPPLSVMTDDGSIVSAETFEGPPVSVSLWGGQILTAGVLSRFNSVYQDALVTLDLSAWHTGKRLFAVTKIDNPGYTDLSPVKNSFRKIIPERSFVKHLKVTFCGEFSDENLPKAGIYLLNGFKEKWVYLDTDIADGILSANSYRAGTLGVFIDHIPPEISENPFYFKSSTVWKVSDEGKGIDEDSIVLKSGKTVFPAEYDPDRKWVFVEKTLKPGNYTLTVLDFACNRSEQEGILSKK